MLTKIVKRDGRIVDFHADKIEAAIHKALAATKVQDGGLARSLASEVVAALERKFADKIPHVEDVQDAVEETLIKHGHAKTAKAYILYRQKRKELREAKRMLGIEDELKLSLNAISVLERRYLLKDEFGVVVETPSKMFQRVANAIASVDKLYDEKANLKVVEEEFYNMLANLEFLPNSPTLMNAGTELGQLSACFVLPVEDSIKSIFNALANMALIHQSGGGTGFSFSRLRPKGDLVKSTHGVASGPVSFMQIFDAATEVIKQGGKRRGANMGILRVDHPDIVEFITVKEKEGVLNNFNISVGITDKFIEAVNKNKEYELINPRTKRPVRKLRARDVFDLLATMAWRTGDPGVVFLDEINRRNPTPSLGEIESTNPCVTGDTLVSTDEGLLPINKVHNPHEVSALDGNFYPVSWAGKTGRREVFRVKTRAGYELKATADHRVLTQNGWKSVAELTGEDRLVLGKIEFGNLSASREIALMLGWLVGDGCITKDNQDVIFYFDGAGKSKILPVFKKYLDGINKRQVKPRVEGGEVRLKYSSKIARMLSELGLKWLPAHEKEVPECVFRMNETGVKNFLSALFAADGSVQGSRRKGVSIRLSSSSLKLLKQVQLLLLQFNVLSRIYENRRQPGPRMLPDSNRKPGAYICHADHELIITRESMFRFMDRVGFCTSNKKQKFEQLKPARVYRDNVDLSVECVEAIGAEDTYDLKEPNTHSFVANGIVVHNCGEVPLLPFESCNLGSINLSRMTRGKDGEAEVDWEKLRRTVHSAVHFLDNVIDANRYPLPEIERMTKANRKIGLGVMGFAEMLLRLGVPYDSKQGIAVAEKVMKFIAEESRRASIALAEKRGSFPNFEASVWKKKYRAMRNATTTTVAPTGSISIIAGTSSSIEPIFAVSFVRNVMGTQLLEVNPVFESIAKERGFYSTELMIEIARRGTIQGIKSIPGDVRRVFVTSMDIAPEWHVRMQAAFQKHVDNAVSKTVNMPNEATLEDVKRIFLLAHRLRCKGITVYRYGSKSEQVLYIGISEAGKGVIANSEYAGGCPTGVCPT